MGCANNQIEYINYDVLNPPVNSNFKNTRLKREDFPEGEIYYLRDKKESKKEHLKKNAKHESEALDGVMAELSVEYKFSRPELRQEFKGSTIKLYHSDISLDNEFTFIGSTEEFDDSDLLFKKKFKMTYCFQKLQIVKVEINYNDNIQVVNTSLGNILGSKELFVEMPFFYKGSTDDCSVIIRAVVIKDENKNRVITINLITDLSNLPYSDYFVVIYNWHHPRRKEKVWKSKETPGKEIIFTADMITLQDLCLGSYNRKITIEYYGIYCGFVGSVIKTLGQLKDAMDNRDKIQILNEDGKEMGYFYVSFSIENRSRFIDLVENGLQIKLSFAIDFTNSNLVYTNPNSLHYIGNHEKLNPYENCLRCFGELISSYDFNHKIALHGFGAIIPSTGDTSHCFPISLTKDPIANGIEEAIKQYREALPKIILDGPTYLFPVFKENLDMLKDDDDCPTSIYHILVIITDGNNNDIDEMVRQLIKSERYPISVCIIGVGDENFSRMLQMDSRTKPLEDKDGYKSERDMCQFVRYNDFKDRPDKMTEYMLNIIPSQVEAYYRASQDFIGINDSGKPKNAYLRKMKENKEKNKLNPQKTKSTFKRSTIKLEEKDKYAKKKENKEEFEQEFINTNLPNIET